VKVHAWRLARTTTGHFRRLRGEPVDLLSTAARGTTVLCLGYSYEDVIGPVDSFRVAHLTCDMIQKRRVVVTSSIGSSVRAISVPRPTRIASPLSSSSARQRDQHFVACCSLFATLANASSADRPLSFRDVLERFHCALDATVSKEKLRACNLAGHSECLISLTSMKTSTPIYADWLARTRRTLCSRFRRFDDKREHFF